MQSHDGNPITLLVAEDDPDHQLLISEALKLANLANGVQFVDDGQDALDFLRRERNYADYDAPLPRLILLDLNMPRMGGFDALHEIKSDPALRSIPVVILTTSDAPNDVLTTYDLGANSYITKPPTFEGLTEFMQMIANYWFRTVSLPSG